MYNLFVRKKDMKFEKMNGKITVYLISVLAVTSFYHHVASGATDIKPLSPTASPTTSPSSLPTDGPSTSPSLSPTSSSLSSPTASLGYVPTKSITPYLSPTPRPTAKPAFYPSSEPISSPSSIPSDGPSLSSMDGPSKGPNSVSNPSPSTSPMFSPSSSTVLSLGSKPSTTEPSLIPSDGPSLSKKPTNTPTIVPSLPPSSISISSSLSTKPTKSHSESPSESLNAPKITFPSLAGQKPNENRSISPNISNLEDNDTPSDNPTDMPSLLELVSQPTISKEMDTEIHLPLIDILPTSIQQTMSSEPTATSRPIGYRIPFFQKFDRSNYGVPSYQPTRYKSLGSSVPTFLSIYSSRTTVSSLFLEQINIPMDSEATEIFSATVLEFLREKSAVNFVHVEVVWQASEIGDSIKNSTTHEPIDGMRIYFATIADIDDSIEVDIARLIGMVFKDNKEEFFKKLGRSTYSQPVAIESRSDQENLKVVENQVDTKPSTFLNTWVISSLGIVIFAVFVTSLLMTKMMKQARPRRIQQEKLYASKAGLHSLYTIEPSYSNHSTETIGIKNEKRETNYLAKTTDKYEAHSTSSQTSNSLTLEYESLAGLRLIGSEECTSTSTPRFTVPKSDTSMIEEQLIKNEEHKVDKLKVRNILSKFSSTEDSVGARQPGYNARMRKRRIERDIQQERSQEGPSLEAILIATLSFNSDEDGGDQVENNGSTKLQDTKNISYGLERSSCVEVADATGNDEICPKFFTQTTLTRFSNFFHKKRKKQHYDQQTIQMEEGYSDVASGSINKEACYFHKGNSFEDGKLNSPILGDPNELQGNKNPSKLGSSNSKLKETTGRIIGRMQHNQGVISIEDSEESVGTAGDSITEIERDFFLSASEKVSQSPQKSFRVDTTQQHTQKIRKHRPSHIVTDFQSSPTSRRLSRARNPGTYSYQYQRECHQDDNNKAVINKIPSTEASK